MTRSPMAAAPSAKAPCRNSLLAPPLGLEEVGAAEEELPAFEAALAALVDV